MTYVRAESGTGGTFMRSDIAVTVLDEQDRIIRQSPLPKIAILAPDLVVGIAGDDPVSGLVNLWEMWDVCEDRLQLMDKIAEDGALNRQHLLLTLEGDVFTFVNGEWAGPRTFGWVGSSEARSLLNPDPFHFDISKADDETKQHHAEWARSIGASEEQIDLVLSGTASAEIGPEIAQLNAMRDAGPDVSEFMIEARPVGGQFQFARQSLVRVFGSPVLRSEDDVLKALFAPAMTVSHRTYSAGDGYPASLAIEFSGALVKFLPCRNRGYSVRIEYLDPTEQDFSYAR